MAQILDRVTTKARVHSWTVREAVYVFTGPLKKKQKKKQTNKKHRE